MRADDPKILTCDILEGHLSSTLPHLANIAYRTKRSLEFDGKSETFKDDKDADKLLTREYRKGFEMLGEDVGDRLQHRDCQDSGLVLLSVDAVAGNSGARWTAAGPNVSSADRWHD